MRGNARHEDLGLGSLHEAIDRDPEQAIRDAVVADVQRDELSKLAGGLTRRHILLSELELRRQVGAPGQKIGTARVEPVVGKSAWWPASRRRFTYGEFGSQGCDPSPERFTTYLQAMSDVPHYVAQGTHCMTRLRMATCEMRQARMPSADVRGGMVE